MLATSVSADSYRDFPKSAISSQAYTSDVADKSWAGTGSKVQGDIMGGVLYGVGHPCRIILRKPGFFTIALLLGLRAVLLPLAQPEPRGDAKRIV